MLPTISPSNSVILTPSKLLTLLGMIRSKYQVVRFRSNIYSTFQRLNQEEQQEAMPQVFYLFNIRRIRSKRFF